ncbi:MAG TPA: hypothetical protein PL029_12010 [Bacteroidia bacterium]|nr:hypothetical protein [Bacteroidia bacterium]
MKKQILTCLSVLLITSIGAAQSDPQNNPLNTDNGKSKNKENIMHEGVNTINFYYGVTISTPIYKALAANSATDIKFKQIGPLGIVYEHLMSDNVGLGVELGYSKLTMTYEESYVNGNGNTVERNFATWEFTTMRAMVRVNIHLVESEHFDTYFLVSAGYRKVDWAIRFSDPNYNQAVSSYRTPFPVGVKPGLGVRYFFTDNMGLNLELALGTPIMCGGLSFRF